MKQQDNLKTSTPMERFNKALMGLSKIQTPLSMEETSQQTNPPKQEKKTK